MPPLQNPPVADIGLRRFIAPSLRRALCEPGAAVRGESFQAAALFADVSGFTALAAAMASQGPAATEELTQHLNRCFGEALRLVRIFGGEVEKFAGDGLLAVFRVEAQGPGGEEGLREATRRAAACARAITRRLDGRQAGEVALGVHVGVGAGTLSALHVAWNAQARAFVLLGEPFAQISWATARAGKGEVCLSPQAQALVGDPAEGDDEAPPGLQRAVYACPPAAIAPYLNQALRERLAVVGDANWIAELRRTTVLFLRLGDVPVDPLAEAPRLAALARTIGEQAARYDGLLHDLLADDKGLIAIVAFGVHQAREDDAERGLRAALDLHAALSAIDRPPSIGVATGRVYCGVVGDGSRCELAVVGEAMNLASRLMGAADSGVLCCTTTATDLRARFVFEQAEARDPKNQALRLPAARPVGPRRAAPRGASGEPWALVGRAQPWAALMEAVIHHQGRPAFRALVVQGEAGIGKSSLVNGVFDVASTRGLRTLRMAGNAIDQVAPYQACAAMVADLLGVDPAMATPQQAARITERLAPLPEVAHLAPLLGAVLPAAPAETPALRAMDAQARAESIRELLLALVTRTAADGPALLLVEDAHWLDSASWALLEGLVHRRLPLLLLVSTRPLEAAARTAMDDFVQAAGAARIVLGPLDPSETAALVCAKLGVDTLSTGVQDLVHGRAAGHPLFTEVLTLALRDAGLLRVEGSLCVLASSEHSADALAIPDTLERVLTSRIDSLQEQQRLVLKVASVLGHRFSRALLAAIYPLQAERAALPAHLGALCAGEFLLDLGEGHYQFRHALTCEAGYALLPFSQRRDLHRAVAEALEQGHGPELQHRTPLLAHHWGHAQVYDRALLAAEKAGTDALERFANREAVHFLREALRFDAALPVRSDAARAARWESLLGRAHRALGEMDASRRCLEAALVRLGCPLPARTLPARLRLGGHLLRMFFHTPSVQAASVAGNGAATTAVDAYNQLAMLAHYGNDVEAMFFCTAHASEHARQAPPSIEVATLYGSIAHIAAFGKLFGPSRRYGRAAQSVAAQVGTPFCTATVHQYTGHLAACLGQLQVLDADMHNALALYAQAGKGRHWEEALINLSYLYAFQGDLPRALQHLQMLEQSGRGRNDSQTASWGMVGQGRVLLQQGRLQEALARFMAAEASTSDSLTWSELYGNRALAHWRLGQRAPALADAVRALEVAEKTPSTSYTTLPGYAAAMETLVSLCLLRPDDASVRGYAERMFKAFGKFAGLFPIAAAQHRLWAGAMATVRGRPGTAQRDWKRAVALAGKSAVRVDEASALHWLARGQTGAARTAALARAGMLFAAIGHGFEAALAQAGVAAGEVPPFVQPPESAP